MEKHIPQEQDNAQALPDEAHRQMSRQFTGVRLRKWGSWVSEIRMPKCRQKLWLGSYKTAEQAARAYDAAVYYMRGPAAKFNFPDSVSLIPPASSLTPQQIQAAAFKYATGEMLSTLHNNKEEPAFPSLLQSTSVSEMELPIENQTISEEEAVWKSLLAAPDIAECFNLDNLPSIDEALALDLIPTSEEGDIFVDLTELWKF